MDHVYNRYWVKTMSLLTKLEYQIDVSLSEKDITNDILENKSSVVEMKISDLAKSTYTSPATISRLCRKLGEASYRDFQVHFVGEIQSHNKEQVDFNRPFLQEDTIDEVSQKINDLYLKTIAGTKALIVQEQLMQIVELIDQSPILDLYAWGDSYLSALMFEHKMTYINQLVSLKHIPTEQNQRALYSNEHTVALVISYSGKSDEMKKIVKIIKEKKGKVIALTSMNDSYLRKNADYCLTLCSKENVIDKIAAYSSKISSDYLLDLIYSLLFQKHYQQYINQKIDLQKEYDQRRNEIMDE